MLVLCWRAEANALWDYCVFGGKRQTLSGTSVGIVLEGRGKHSLGLVLVLCRREEANALWD